MCGIGAYFESEIIISPSVREQLRQSRQATQSQSVGRKKLYSEKISLDSNNEDESKLSIEVNNTEIKNGNSTVHEMMSWIYHRGKETQRICKLNDAEVYILSSVLNLRGNEGNPTKQPIVDQKYVEKIDTSVDNVDSCEYLTLNNNTESIFAWNGEIFGGDITIRPGENDSQILYELMTKECKLNESSFLTNKFKSLNNSDTVDDFVNEHRKAIDHDTKLVASICMSILDRIQGPYALIFMYTLPDNTKITIFSRDRIGRRSLTLSLSGITDILNVTNIENSTQVVVNGLSLCSVSLLNNNTNNSAWFELPCNGVFTLTSTSNFNFNSNSISSYCDFFPWAPLHLRSSLFPYRHLTYQPLHLLPPLPTPLLSLLPSLPLPSQHFLRRLAHAVSRHVNALPTPTPISTPSSPSTLSSTSSSSSPSSTSSPISVLFSGGVDCTVLAALLHFYTPSNQTIDLINVAFQGDALPEYVDTTVPDRVSGINGYNELCNMTNNFNNRNLTEKSQNSEFVRWRLIKVNITVEMMEKHKSDIYSLMKPHSTVMDFNIAAVLYFASLGKGILHENNPDQPLDKDNEAMRLASDLDNMKITSLTPEEMKKKKDEEKKLQREAFKLAKAKEKREKAEQERLAALEYTSEELTERRELVKKVDKLGNMYRKGLLKPLNDESDDEYTIFMKDNLDRLIYFKNETAIKFKNELESPEITFNNQENIESNQNSEKTPDFEQKTTETIVECVSPVLLLGSGADEQLGGYGRHRNGWVYANRWIKTPDSSISESQSLSDDVSHSKMNNDGDDDENEVNLLIEDCSGDEEDIDVGEDMVTPPTALYSSYNPYTDSNTTTKSRPCKFLRRQQRGLRAELNRDIHRLWVRNLGRDDRVVSHWNREGRHPFLDEDVMKFLTQFKADWKIRYFETVQDNIEFMAKREEYINLQLSKNPSIDPGCVIEEDNLIYPLESLCDMTLKPGIGDKLLLRTIAVSLGLNNTGKLIKRAMQFGTKIAKRESEGTSTMNIDMEVNSILNTRYLIDPITKKRPGEMTKAEMKKLEKKRSDEASKLSLQKIRNNQIV